MHLQFQQDRAKYIFKPPDVCYKTGYGFHNNVRFDSGPVPFLVPFKEWVRANDCVRTNDRVSASVPTNRSAYESSRRNALQRCILYLSQLFDRVTWAPLQSGLP